MSFMNLFRATNGFRNINKDSGFKGSEAEHKIVKLEKKVLEKSRMLFALDIKIKNIVSDEGKVHYQKKRNKMSELLSSLIDELEEKSSYNRFHRFIEKLDKEDQYRRDKRKLRAA